MTAPPPDPGGRGVGDTISMRYASPQVGRPPTRFEVVAYRFVRGAIVGFAKLFWRLEVHGAEHVPPTGPFVLSAIHRSNMDTPLVCAVTQRRLRYMGKKEMWKFRFSAWFFTTLGGFPVDRGAADREALRTCVALIDEGDPIVMFPEGTRRQGPVVEHFYDGPAYIAARTGAPIVPVGIGGSAAAMPVGARTIRPAKVVLIVGEPLLAPLGTDGRRPSRRQIRATTEALRQRIETLFDEAQERAGHPNRR